MTKKDFQVIANTLAYCEAHCDNAEEAAMVEWVTEKFAETLKAAHPRFNVGTFTAAALPIKSRERKAAILAKLNA
jgi:hypothetical protein